jgi:hypothetical protein
LTRRSYARGTTCVKSAGVATFRRRFEAVAIWSDHERKERRTLHRNGDGTFTVDGRILDFRDRMVRWKQFQVKR